MRKLILAACPGLGLAGCSAATDIVATPFHITADVVRVIPVVGDVVAAPFDIAGNVID
jgi:hypothetical protein